MPTFKFPLSQPSLLGNEEAYVVHAVKGGWISGTGSYVTAFEDALRRQMGRGYAVAVANGTVALELALLGLDIGAGDEVLVPALTFIAPAAAVKRVGATPVLIDIDPVSLTIDVEKAALMVTNRTRAIIAVDLLGHTADYNALREIFHKKIHVIEDAAQAHGAQYRGMPAGSFGRVSTFSFHANKAITCGEGGAVLTDDIELADRMRLIANHGMRPHNPYWHSLVGTNFRMSNLQAAVGVAQMERWDELIDGRRRIALIYERYFSELPIPFPIKPREGVEWCERSVWLATFFSPHASAIVERLRARGVDARKLWPAVPMNTPYEQPGGSFPHAMNASKQGFWLPTYHDLSVADMESIVLALVDN